MKITINGVEYRYHVRDIDAHTPLFYVWNGHEFCVTSKAIVENNNLTHQDLQDKIKECISRDLEILQGSEPWGSVYCIDHTAVHEEFFQISKERFEELRENRKRICLAREEDRRRQRERDRAERQKREEEKEQQYIRDLKEKVRAGKSISGGELIDLCKELGMEIPIRTQGAMKNCREITDCSYRTSSKFTKKHPSHYYRECKKVLEEENVYN